MILPDTTDNDFQNSHCFLVQRKKEGNTHSTYNLEKMAEFKQPKKGRKEGENGKMKKREKLQKSLLIHVYISSKQRANCN